MVIPGRCSMGVLVLYLKNIYKYFRIDVEIETKDNRKRRITFGNDFSNSRINSKECLIPIKCNFGWNYLKFDLNKISNAAFGVGFRFFNLCQIFEECVIWKAFLEQKEYLHTELPTNLQVIPDGTRESDLPSVSEDDLE